MKKSHFINKVIVVTLFSYLVLITIGYFTTTSQSRIFIEPLRIIAAIIVILGIGLSLGLKRVCFQQILGVMLFVLIWLWGVMLSLATGSFYVVSSELAVNTLVMVSGVLLFCSLKGEIFTPQVVKFLVSYIFLGLLITLLIGGLDLSFPPHFNLEYTKEGRNQSAYSQGVSRIFGFGAIASVVLLFSANQTTLKIVFSVLVLVFSALSLIGGARGDSVFAIVLVLGYVWLKKPKQFLLFLLPCVGVIYLAADDWSWIEDLLIFQRLFSANVPLGHRDELLGQALNLLLNEPGCLIFGCGFGYFQFYYGHEIGMYPHNLFVECLITFGLPATLLLLSVVIGGIGLFVRRTIHFEALMLFFAYFLLLSLKSGSILTEWLTITLVMYFASLKIGNLVARNGQVHLQSQRIWNCRL